MTNEQIKFILDCMEPLVGFGIIISILLMIFLALKIFQTFASIDVDRAVKKYNSNDLDFRSLYYDLVEKYNDLEEKNIEIEKFNDELNNLLEHIQTIETKWYVFRHEFRGWSFMLDEDVVNSFEDLDNLIMDIDEFEDVEE